MLRLPMLREKRLDPEGQDTSEEPHLEVGAEAEEDSEDADADELDEPYLTPLPAAGEAMVSADDC